MERKKIEYSKLVLIIIIILYCIGFVVHFIDYFKSYLSELTTIFLFVIFVLIITEDQINKKFTMYILVSYLFTFSIEVLGVKTGLIFGSYNYGKNLGLKVFDVPLVIGMNWISLLLGSIGIASIFKNSIILRSILTGLLMVIFDAVIEQVSCNLDYWFWKDNLIPIQNFIAWFIISFFLSYFYFVLQPNRKLILARYNFIIQLIFFFLLFELKINI